MKSRSRLLHEKSVTSLVAAIELFNKPNVQYREESFAVLCVNAWELLLKARILQLANNRMSALFIYKRKKLNDGTRSAKRYRVKSRSGHPLTIGLFDCIALLESSYGERFDATVKANLEVLVEIRDLAIHFINDNKNLQYRVYEVGVAAVNNFVKLSKIWMGSALEGFNFYMLPIGTFSLTGDTDAINANPQERGLIKYLDEVGEKVAGTDKDFSYMLAVDIRFVKSKDDAAKKVRVTNEPGAPEVKISEEDIREKYPLRFDNLNAKLKQRYSDFKQNAFYHRIRKELEKDERFCKARLLDPSNPDSTKINFYNGNIIREFDKYYTKRK